MEFESPPPPPPSPQASKITTRKIGIIPSKLFRQLWRKHATPHYRRLPPHPSKASIIVSRQVWSERYAQCAELWVMAERQAVHAVCVDALLTTLQYIQYKGILGCWMTPTTGTEKTSSRQRGTLPHHGKKGRTQRTAPSDNVSLHTCGSHCRLRENTLGAR